MTSRLQCPRCLVHAGPQQDEGDLIDMTAMVDIVFFLLIFFMVTSMHAKQASIAAPDPERMQDGPTSPRVHPDNAITVRIEADDTILVDDEESIGRQDLIARLRHAGDDQMVVRAHGEARHGTVVMVLDAGTDAGMNDVRLVTVDESES
jgi:biopolymer transport protein ExbD